MSHSREFSNTLVILYRIWLQQLKVQLQTIHSVSRHMVVCRAAQEAGAPHHEYIYRKKVNAIFTPL